MRRHFTVTGFVSWQRRTLLHWHAKSQLWLPPGGHVELNEDPLQAVLREVAEETGMQVILLPTMPRFPYAAPVQLPAPATIMVEEIPETAMDPAHQHLDLIYFTRPTTGDADASKLATSPTDWHWVTASALRANEPLAPTPGTAPVAIPEDVRVLGLAAIDRATQEE